MDDAERDDALSFLREGWKDAAVFAVSAKTGAGVADFAGLYSRAHEQAPAPGPSPTADRISAPRWGKMAQYGRQFYVEVLLQHL